MDGPGDAGNRGPDGSLKRIAATLLALAGTRVELIGVELREEALRAQRLLLMGIVAAFLLGAALVLAGALVAAAFWDTHRLLTLAALVLVYGGAGVAILLRMRSAARDEPLPFAATAREFEADLEMLRGPSGGDPR